MTTYREQLAAIPETRTRYVTREDFRRQKTALTRAVNSGDPIRVLRAVEKTLGEWQGHAWPDDWARWARALEDASWAARQAGDFETSGEIAAAGLVLFR